MGKVVSGVTDAIGLTDSKAGQGDMAAASASQREILDRLSKIDLPDIDKMRVVLESPELVGLLEAEELGESALGEIEEDPRLRQAQMDALQELSERGETGFTVQDMGRLEEAQEAAAAQERAQQASILQGMAQRGTLDSGMQLAAQLAASQNAANQGRAAARDIAMQAANARQDALARSANLASNIGQQDYSRDAAAAQAADRIAQFNLENRQGIDKQNLGLRQSYADKATDTRNQQQLYNAGLEQQQFQNRMSKAGAQNQAQGNIAQTQMAMGQSKAQGAANQLGGLLSAGTTLAAAAISDKNAKTNIKPVNSESIESKLEELLGELKAYKYDYKNPEKHGEGKQLGVMAQDLEKSELGQEFVEEDMEGTKRIDYGKMAGTQLAGLADLYNRVKKLENNNE